MSAREPDTFDPYDFDDQPTAPAKEEPDCGDCYDTGCRNRNPTRPQFHIDNLRWKLSRLYHRLFRRGQLHDEPLF